LETIAVNGAMMIDWSERYRSPRNEKIRGSTVAAKADGRYEAE
jgi:hypothetical protein